MVIIEPLIDIFYDLIKQIWLNSCELYRASYDHIYYKIEIFSLESLRYSFFNLANTLIALIFFILLLIKVKLRIIKNLWLSWFKSNKKSTNSTALETETYLNNTAPRKNASVVAYAEHLINRYQNTQVNVHNRNLRYLN